MSSMPPPPPPFQHYDPKAQWRIYREQQKAQQRAQREAWKAQRHAYKANYESIYGPCVPSLVGPLLLIGVGIVALLIVTGRIPAGAFWGWYGHWWPLLLIAAGLALLGEWAVDVRRGSPIRRRGSFVGILILLAVLGVCAAGWNNCWAPWRAEWGDRNDNFFNALGLPERENVQNLSSGALSANNGSVTYLDIENPRGDVTVTAGDGNSIDVQAREVAFAETDAAAKKIFDSEAVQIASAGSLNSQTVRLASKGDMNGRVNLTVTVPKSVRVTVNSGKGDVSASGLGGGLNLTARGDVRLNNLAGSVQVHFNGKGASPDHARGGPFFGWQNVATHTSDLSAHQIDGDLATDGDLNDLTLSGIKGRVTVNGEIFGDVHMESVTGALHLHTSKTDLEVAELPGDLTLDSDNLRVSEARGEVRVVTRGKDIDLNQIYGDTTVEDHNGSITVEPAGTFGVEAKNDKGDVEVTLPPSASAMVDGRTRNGDIVTEFALPISGEESKTVSGKIGSGAARIKLSTENGDVRIKKGSEFPAAPAAPNVPKLKASKALPPHPVTQ